MSRTITSASPETTRQLGQKLGALLQPGDLVCLQGDLGAGKTTFVQGLAQGWGSLDSVSSPTFILVNMYRRADASQLFHLDAYRIDSIPEAEELDLDAMLAQGPLVIEWPERIGKLIPPQRLWVTFDYMSDEHRQMVFKASGKHYDNLLDEIRKTMFGGG